MKREAPKKVFVLQDGKYIELTYNEYCIEKEKNDLYINKSFLFLHGILMEVSKDVYADFHYEERRQKYLRVLSIKNDDFSYDALTNDEFRGEDILIDDSKSVCEKAIDNIMIEKIKLALQLISDEERELIKLHFFDDIPQSKLALMYEVNQSNISRRINKIIQKIKKIIKI